MGTTEIRSIENYSKPINTRARREVLFRFQMVKTESFSVKYSRIVSLSLNLLYNSQYTPISDLMIFVLNLGLLTSKKVEYVFMCFCVFFTNNNFGNTSFILAQRYFQRNSTNYKKIKDGNFVEA